MSTAPILVTGAAGRVGGIGRSVVELLRKKDIPVRALVRQDDDRAASLRSLGAEVVVADLTKPDEVARALQGCRRVYFSLSVSPEYLEATAIMAAAAKEQGGIELIVNMSQMTISSMSLTQMTGSPQHQLHWLSEQILNWSGVPVVQLRPTVFQQNPLFWDMPAMSLRAGGIIRLPFGKGRTSPVAAIDVAEVSAAILLDPPRFVGRVVELTGPQSVDMDDIAAEYSAALGREVRYQDVPLPAWEAQFQSFGLPDHVRRHIVTMAKLHALGRYDRLTNTVEEILGRPATSFGETLRANVDKFQNEP